MSQLDLFSLENGTQLQYQSMGGGGFSIIDGSGFSCAGSLIQFKVVDGLLNSVSNPDIQGYTLDGGMQSYSDF